MAFMPTLRTAIHDTITGACNDTSSSLQSAHVKELLKLALVAVRQTKRVASGDEAAAAWQPAKWSALSSTLAANDRFKASVGLQAMCKQIVGLLQDSTKAGTKAQRDKQKSDKKSKEEKGGTSKRKAEAVDGDEGEEGAAESGKKAKHKKARKAKATS